MGTAEPSPDLTEDPTPDHTPDHLVALGALTDAVDLLAGLDPESLSSAAWHQLAIGLESQRHRLGAIAADALNHWDRSGIWALDGSRNAAVRLARETRCAVRSARAEMRRARRLRKLPATKAALLANQISLDHLDLLGSALTSKRRNLHPTAEVDLLTQCRALNFVDAVKTVKYWVQLVDAEADTPTPPAHESFLHVSSTFQQNVVISGELNPIHGSIVMNELNRLENQIRLDDEAAGTPRTPAERRALALVEMARRSGSTAAGSKPPRPLFTVLLGEDSFTHMCELAEGVVLPPDHLEEWIGTADLETVLFDGPSRVISVSSKRRFTGALRRAIEVRDRHCTHPSGCDVPADRCDVDHVIPYSEHGSTDQFNGRLQCSTHNRIPAKHVGSGPSVVDAAAHPTVLDQIRGRLRYRMRHDAEDAA
jgi:hypothetical protein